jgi:CHAT domain-containing protein/Tfp pilus assembly protein PilF
MVARTLLLCLPLLVPLTTATAQEKNQPVRFADDFATDSRPRYQVQGDVGWRPGELRLAAEASLARPLPLGLTAELRAVVRLAAADPAAEVGFNFLPAPSAATLWLRRDPKRTVLHQQARYPAEAEVSGAGDAWSVRVELHYGVLRAKAWPAGEREPAAWQTARHTGQSGWLPRAVGLTARPKNAVAVTALEVRSSPPPAPFTEEQKSKLAEAQTKDREALALHRKGEYGPAAALRREVVALRAAAYGAAHPATASTLHNLAYLLREGGDLPAARATLERSLALRRATLGPDHTDTAASLTLLGVVLHAQGEPLAARPCLEQALAVRRALLGPTHPDTAETLNTLASLLADLGERAAARRAYEEVLAVRKQVHGAGHPNTATTLNNLGLVQWRQGDAAAAQASFEQTLAIYTARLGPDHPYAAQARMNLALALGSRREFPAARAHLEQSLAIFRHKLGPEHPDTIQCLFNLGSACHADGDLAAARRFGTEALELWQRRFGPEHPRVARALNFLGRLRAADGNRAAAWRHLTDGVAVEARHTERLVLVSAQRQHAQLVLQWRANLDTLCNLAERMPDLGAPQRYELLAAVMRWNAISSQALRARQEALLAADAPDLQSRLDEVRAARQQLVNTLLRGPGRRTVEEHRDELERTRRHLDELERDLANRAGGLAVLQGALQAGPAEVVRRLAPDAVLVELVRYHGYDFAAHDPERRWQKPRYAALLLSRTANGPDIHLVPLGEAAPLDKAIHAWRAKVQAGAADDASAAELRRHLWEPLAAKLPGSGVRQLLIAADGELALVPFEALRLDDGKYLIEHYRIAYVSSGRDLMPRPLPKERPAVALVLADPDYDAVGEPKTLAPEAKRPPGADAPGSPGMRFQSLSGFGREADAVADLFRGRTNWQVRSLRGAEASEEALAQVKRPRLLHCVTHGFFLRDLDLSFDPGGAPLRKLELVVTTSAGPAAPQRADPRLRSGLALAGANKWQERSAKGFSDGLLTALEVENLDLWGTELVVLSACETGRGEVQVGEGALGLRRAFQLAGAQAVLASLWMVPDAETSQLMTDCLKRWRDGAAPAEALRQAQLEMIRRLRLGASANRQAPPLYWAGFICHGATRWPAAPRRNSAAERRATVARRSATRPPSVEIETSPQPRMCHVHFSLVSTRHPRGRNRPGPAGPLPLPGRAANAGQHAREADQPAATAGPRRQAARRRHRGRHRRGRTPAPATARWLLPVRERAQRP